MKTYLQYSNENIEMRDFNESLISEQDFANQFNAIVVSKEKYESYLNKLKEQEDLLKPVTFIVPTDFIRTTGASGGNATAIALIDDLRRLNNGSVSVSEDGLIATISLKKQFYSSLSDGRKSEIEELVKLANK